MIKCVHKESDKHAGTPTKWCILFFLPTEQVWMNQMWNCLNETLFFWLIFKQPFGCYTSITANCQMHTDLPFNTVKPC